MKAKIVGIILVLGLSISSSVYAEMSSTNFIIRADSISAGGGEAVSGSGDYTVRDSVSPIASGNSSSSSFNLRAGLRPMIFDQIVTIDIGLQDTSANSSVASLVGTDITVLSAAAFAEGDLVVLVQDVITTHLSAVGKIISIVGSVITVDELVSSGTPSIDGTNDILYVADGTSLGLGSLDDGRITHRVLAWEVSADIPNGFSVFLSEDGGLRDGVNEINDVADGEVTAGAEEFGGRSSDTSLGNSTFDTADTAITSTPQEIGSVSGAAFDSKGLVDLKASIDALTTVGSYANDLFIIASPTY
ncbi:MAG: hypothetical protein O2877_00255 [bacterium]|nr:hypothetical protein [bacterium]